MFGWDYIELTDDSTTLVLHDGASYGIAGGAWAPAVPALRTSPLSGIGDYEDAEETIPLIITGTTPGEVYERWRQLRVLLDQAERWQRGQSVAAVRLRVLPRDSRLVQPLEAVIYRRPGDPLPLIHAPVYDDAIERYIMTNVTVQVRRYTGQWHGASQSVSGAAQATSTLWTATWDAALTTPGFLDIDLTPPGGANQIVYTPTMLLVASDTAPQIRLAVRSATSYADGVHFTSIVDPVVNSAASGNILRYAPPNTSWNGTDGGSAVGIVTPGTAAPDSQVMLAIFAMVRSSTAACDWQLRHEVYGNNTIPGISTAPVLIRGADCTSPRPVFLGQASGAVLFTPMDTQTYVLRARASTTSGSPRLDINAIAYLLLMDTTSRVISNNTQMYLEFPIRIRSQILSRPNPLISWSQPSPAATYPIGHTGNAALLTQQRTQRLVWLAATPGQWTLAQASSNTQYLYTPTFTRRPSYLTPE